MTDLMLPVSEGRGWGGGGVIKQSGHENYEHDHTRYICLIFYQLLPTTSVGNE